MKTKLLIWLLPAILIALSGDQAFACSVNPVAVLAITPYVYDSYLNRWYSPVGQVFFNGDASRDPDGGDPEIKLFEWNFGDGSSYSESPSGCGDGEFDGITSHTYTAPGIYTITFKVTDNDADEGSPPDKWNTTTCTIAVVSVNLVVEGVPDNMKVTPGAFISHNNDDDNDEGTADKDETGTVTGEDNLIKITLSVSPTLGDSDGKVRLSIPYGQRELRIWQYPDKGNLVLHGEEGMYYKDWRPTEVPENLYVEGYLSSTSTLWLSHMKNELTIHYDTVKFRCVDLNVSSDASSPLDDWPKTATEIRSPKYIFGKEDPIYVQATNLGIDPGLAETRNNLVKVTSQTGGPVYLTLKETDLASLFNNVAALGELLYLSDADSDEADGDTIKVVDEEKLTFWLEIQPGSGNYVSCYRVMLDRGEYAACGIAELFSDAVRFADEMQAARVNWWEAGYNEFPDNIGGSSDNLMKHFIKDAGENAPEDLESDFLYVTCHGPLDPPNGDLLDNAEPEANIIMNGWPPPWDIEASSDWNTDLDWVWIDACRILDTDPSGPLPRPWEYALFGSPRPVHMILSYHDGVAFDGRPIITAFFDHAVSEGRSIVDAFYHANTDWTWDEDCAILEHFSNDGDYIFAPTRDTSDPSMRYYWYDASGNDWEHEDFTHQGTSVVRSYTDAEIEVNTRLLDAPLPVVRVLEAEAMPLGTHPQGFARFKTLWGLEVFSKPLTRTGVVPQNDRAALMLAEHIVAEIYPMAQAQDIGTPCVSTLYVKDFQRGEDMDPRSGVPMLMDVKYSHYVDGIPVVGDLISVAVKGDAVVKIRACWHTAKAAQGAAKKVNGIEKAMPVAAHILQEALMAPSTVRFLLRGADLCYYGYHDAGKAKKQFRPAWSLSFKGEDGKEYNVFVDAYDNSPINHKLDIQIARRKQQPDAIQE